MAPRPPHFSVFPVYSGPIVRPLFLFLFCSAPICSLDHRGPRLHRPLSPDLATRLTWAAHTRRRAGSQGGCCAPARALHAGCGVSARKRESWAPIAGLVEDTEPEKTAALTDAIVAAVGAGHADKLGESTN
ncbi:hypothetical protein BC826DRAFT_172067 [Russula brevipes]|nr:hypothetical protein BC826DRAFT_172067 [Russula brevipes]